MSQADAKHPFDECREGQIPRPLGRFKFDAPLLAPGFLTAAAKAADPTWTAGKPIKAGALDLQI